jgi:hypothetical protein
MSERGFWRLNAVSDARLQNGLKELLANGARTEARIVAHLAEVDARKLHLTMGASSLFDYCLTRLGLSNNEAFHRITAARLARRFPVIFELLERRDVHLTAVCLLRDYLTPDNHLELLREVSHKTKLEIDELLTRRFPRPDVASALSRLPDRAPRAFEPLSEGRYRLQSVGRRRRFARRRGATGRRHESFCNSGCGVAAPGCDESLKFPHAYARLRWPPARARENAVAPRWPLNRRSMPACRRAVRIRTPCSTAF